MQLITNCHRKSTYYGSLAMNISMTLSHESIRRFSVDTTHENLNCSYRLSRLGKHVSMSCAMPDTLADTKIEVTIPQQMFPFQSLNI